MLGLAGGYQLNILRDKAGPLKAVFLSEDLKNGLIVSVERSEGSELSAGEVCTLQYRDSSAVFSCRCKVERSLRNPGTDAVGLTMVSPLERTQRREDFRLRLSMPCSLGREENGCIRFYAATTVDVSGGGAAVCLGKGLKPGDPIVFTQRYGELGTLSIPSTVCWIRPEPMPSDPLHAYSCGVLFAFTNQKDKDQLIRYITHQQFKQRRDGLA